jgi:hypothetical protein
MAKVKNYYGDVVVLAKVRARILFETAKTPTPVNVLQALKKDHVSDIVDIEFMEFREVLDADLEEQDDDA